MTDSVPSDHPSLSSHRVNLSPVGHTGRVQILLPDECTVSDGDVVCLSLAGKNCYSRITTTLAGERTVRGAFANRRLAREEDEAREDENQFLEWVREAGFDAGDALVFDVITEGHVYGLRPPGERTVYRPPDPPDSSLADIARSLGSDSRDDS